MPLLHLPYLHLYGGNQLFWVPDVLPAEPVVEKGQVDKTTLLAALRRKWEYEGKDYDISHEIYHEDAVLEFPQSQERFVGKENFLA